MFNQTNEIKDNVHMTDGNFVTYDMCFQCIIYQGLLPSEIKRFIKKRTSSSPPPDCHPYPS